MEDQFSPNAIRELSVNLHRVNTQTLNAQKKKEKDDELANWHRMWDGKPEVQKAPRPRPVELVMFDENEFRRLYELVDWAKNSESVASITKSAFKKVLYSPEDAVTPKPVQVADPIGFPDGFGNWYIANGDQHAVGEIYTDGRGSFKKADISGGRNPFGSVLRWVKQARKRKATAKK